MVSNGDLGSGGWGSGVRVTEDLDSPSEMMSLEDWVLERLQAPGAELCGVSMDMVLGELISLETCIQHVKLASKHDEIAAAYKKAVLQFEKKNPDNDEVWFLKYLGLWVFKKLDAEKKGETVDWDEFGMKRAPGADSTFIENEVKIAWE